jgi:hypothetical protein
MKRLVGLIFILLSWADPSHSVPVVPNYTSGKLDSTTTQRQVISEVIVSEDYNSGFVYSVSGTGIEPSTGHINATGLSTIRHTTTDGGTSTWTGLDLETAPNWSLSTPGGTFTMTTSYQGPGLRNRTTITRTQEIETSIVSSSVFSQ